MDGFASAPDNDLAKERAYSITLFVILGLWLVLRLLVYLRTLYRSSVITIDFIKLSTFINLPHTDTECEGKIDVDIHSPWKWKFTGQMTDLPTHCVAEYNYCLDCLNYSSITPKAPKIFGLSEDHKLVWTVIFFVEAGSAAVIIFGTSEQSTTWHIIAIILSSFWILVYLYVNVMVLYVNVRNYWTCSILLPHTGPPFVLPRNSSNEFLKGTKDDFNFSYDETSSISASVTLQEMKVMVYHKSWLIKHCYAPQCFIIHRLIFYIVNVMGLTFDPPVLAGGFWMLLWLGMFIGFRSWAQKAWSG